MNTNLTFVVATCPNSGHQWYRSDANQADWVPLQNDAMRPAQFLDAQEQGRFLHALEQR